MKTLLIDAVIGTGENEISAKMVRDWIGELDGSEPITVKIHSEGGSVHEGFAIHDALAAYPGEKHFLVESMAFSIASLIPMSGSTVKISPNGYMMLHNPYVSIEGTGAELAKTATLLSQLGETMVAAYSARTGMDADAVRSIMQAETFLNAQDAVRLGFADSITESPVTGRALNSQSLLKLPHGVVLALFGNSSDTPTEKPQMSQNPARVAATAKAIKAKFPRANSDFVVKCMEKEMTMEEVTDEYMEETEEEAVSLKAQVDELMARVKAMEEKETADACAKTKAMEEEKKEVEAKARLRGGVAPIGGVLGASGKDGDPRSEWLCVVNEYAAKGMSRAKAVSAANKTHGHVRDAMVAAAGVRQR